MSELMQYLERAVKDGASDLFLVAGGPACEKLDGSLHPISTEKLMPERTEKLLREIYGFAGRVMEENLAKGDDDFSFSISGFSRFPARRQTGQRKSKGFPGIFPACTNQKGMGKVILFAGVFQTLPQIREPPGDLFKRDKRAVLLPALIFTGCAHALGNIDNIGRNGARCGQTTCTGTIEHNIAYHISAYKNGIINTVYSRQGA